MKIYTVCKNCTSEIKIKGRYRDRWEIKKWMFLLLSVFFVTCNEAKEIKTNDNCLLCSDLKEELQVYITSIELLDHLVYAIETVDSFPNWDFPIVYIIEIDTTKIRICPFYNCGVHWIYENDQYEPDFGVGFFEYENYVVQIFDDKNMNRHYNYYNSQKLISLNEIEVKLAYESFDSYYDDGPYTVDQYGFLEFQLERRGDGLIMINEISNDGRNLDFKENICDNTK